MGKSKCAFAAQLVQGKGERKGGKIFSFSFCVIIFNNLLGPVCAVLER